MAKSTITTRDQLVSLTSPKAVADFAKELKGFVVSQNLYTPIQEKNYVNVEGWQFAGASMGIFPVVEELEDVSPSGGNEIKYRAKVKLVQVQTDKVVGSGVAVCSSKESKRRNADEYVIASMAQTRATGKAFRNCIGWVMKLAGYEGSPAEEAQDKPEAEEPVTKDEMPIDDVKYLVTVRLADMTAANKTRFLKEHTGQISDKIMTDDNYRRLYAVLAREKAKEAA